MIKEQLDALKGHTPGPWKLLEGFGDCGVYAGKLELLHYTYKHDGRNKANAQLIAAAPDLLAHIDEQQMVIDKLVDSLSTFLDTAVYTNAPGFTYEIIAARDALDKARGLNND